MKRFMVVQHTYAEFLGPIEKQLESRDIGFQYMRPFLDQDLPSSAPQHDSLWLLGGAYPITDEDACPWVDGERRLIQAFLQMKRPIVGIGFGGLLLAHQAGGEAFEEPYFNAYWTTAHATDAGRDDPLANAVDGKRILVMYNGQVTLPTGVPPLVVDDAGNWLAARPHDYSYAMLFRPEMKPGMIEDMIMEDNRPLPDNIGELLEQSRSEWQRMRDTTAEIAFALVSSLDLMTERRKTPVFAINQMKPEG
jgi:GMP synthase-like glutamine amidotransferase